MSTKEKVYSLLRHSNKPISGEFLAKELNLSRTAIWKAINSLKNEGHLIQGKPNEGYFILEESKEFNAEATLSHLNPNNRSHVVVYETIESTNTIAKQMAELNEPEWSLILSKNQTKGRGRFERAFYSPSGGLYMSFIIRPSIQLNDVNLITMNAAIAVYDAVKKYCHIDLGIKWVNDLFLDDKKVVGILTEAAIDFESKSFKYVVVGIGINLKLSKIPNDLKSIITDLNISDDFDKNLFVAEIINNFAINTTKSKLDIVSHYRSNSIVINREVFISGSYSGYAKVLEITDDGELIVETKQGEKIMLNSGEISLRRINHE